MATTGAGEGLEDHTAPVAIGKHGRRLTSRAFATVHIAGHEGSTGARLMIIRRNGGALLLITQPDHAALAARIMRQWRSDGLPNSPRRDLILLAIAQHDNGWHELDAAPIVDPHRGVLLDYLTAPNEVRRGVWPRGIERLAPTPYAAALVAQHALHIYARSRGDPAWAPFFTQIEAARDLHLRAAAAATIDQLLADYAFVRIGDLLSLTFCNAWTDRQTDALGYTVRFDGSRLAVSPDPFAGTHVPLAVVARRVPDAPVDSACDPRDLWQRALPVTLSGVASGR